MSPGLKGSLVVVLGVGIPIVLVALYLSRKSGPAGLPVGVVSGDAIALANAAGVSVDTLAMARMVASESGRNATRAEMVARAWVLRNDARALGWSVFRTATFHAANVGSDGKKTANPRDQRFGSQSGHGRYATGKDHTAATLAVARDVIANRIPDPTGGAVKFVDIGSLAKQKGVTKTFADIDATFGRKEGRERVQLAGLPRDLVFYRPTRGAIV